MIDRLLDDDPDDETFEEQPDYEAGLADLERCVLRDVRWLLNARTGCAPAERATRAAVDPLCETVLRQGLPDLTNLDLLNESEQELLRREIAAAIQRFEPRLAKVEVGVTRSPEGGGRTRFQIAARLLVDPEPVKLSFDATVVWRSRTVEIT